MGLLARLGRADWLGEIQAVLVGGLAAVGVVGFLGIRHLLFGDTVDAHVSAHAVGLDGDHSGVILGPYDDVAVQVPHPSATQRFWATLDGAPTYVVVVVLLLLLLRLVRDAQRDDPFRPEVVRALWVIAAVTLCGGVLAWAAELFARYALTASVTPAVGLTMTIPYAWILAGFGFLAVGEVVRRGVRLRTELDEVI